MFFLRTVSTCIFLLCILLVQSKGQSYKHNIIPDSEGIVVTRIVSDSLFNSHQRICLLAIDKDALADLQIELAYQRAELLKTSQIAESRNALAAINGSFFDMDEGGSVTYLEGNDSVFSRSRSSELKWSVPDSLANGALVLNKNNILEIDSAEKDQVYESSFSEAFVMISGPLLITNSTVLPLPDMNFANKRHPRTCVCITRDSILFITIDGRSEQAEGMNLMEVQKFLLDLGCTDAINLDGGGSTCMWTYSEGVVNKPSDKTGERPVANALIILKK
jgi:exopolysaccharide biosynthesis protein